MKPTSELKASPAVQTEMNVNREERVRMRAYELYVQRNRGDGHDVEDWLDAEAELRGVEPKPKLVAA